MKIILASLVLLLGLSMVPVPAHAAFDFFPGADCDTNDSSAVCSSKTPDGDNPISGKNGLLLKITTLVAFIAGIAALIIILISSIKYITSGGDPQKASSAKNTLFGALIGLAIIVLAASLISFVVSRL